MSEQTNGKKARSTAYPAHDLEAAVGYTKAMRDNLGNGPYSRDLAAKALGHANGINGASSAKIAACVHFGLLTRTGNTYSQSEIANMLFTPEDENESELALRNAVLSPTLYKKLITEYEGSALPGMLDNILVRTYKLTEKVAKQAAADFKKSADFAGVLVHGVVNSTLQSPGKPESARNNQNNAIDDDDEEDVDNLVDNTPKTPAGYVTIILPGTDVRVLFPPEYAYDLSIGSFSHGIKSLEQAVKGQSAVVNSHESDTPA